MKSSSKVCIVRFSSWQTLLLFREMSISTIFFLQAHFESDSHHFYSRLIDSFDIDWTFRTRSFLSSFFNVNFLTVSTLFYQRNNVSKILELVNVTTIQDKIDSKRFEIEMFSFFFLQFRSFERKTCLMTKNSNYSFYKSLKHRFLWQAFHQETLYFFFERFISFRTQNSKRSFDWFKNKKDKNE
jgi:hypothetical protein